MSARVKDINGYYEVRRNPISKVGVYPYLGRNIPGAPDQRKVYNVLRPAEELGSPETIESFKLIPWIDDHPTTLLGGAEDGLIDAGAKGVHGTIGERVEFDGDTLYGNIKVYSRSLADAVDAGKRELSPGYRCIFDPTPGEFNGQAYDYVQRSIRGNHLASVDLGRTGPDVAVLDDFSIIFDAKDIDIMADPTNENTEGSGEMSLAEMTKLLKEILPQFKAMQEMVAELNGTKTGEEVKVEEVIDEVDPAAKAAAEAPVTDEATTKQVAALDAAVKDLTARANGNEKAVIQTLAKRDKLAVEISKHVGAFDSAEMTLGEVAAYGVEKLKVPHVKGAEIGALEAFLAGRAAAPVQTFGMDSARPAPGAGVAALNAHHASKGA